MKRPLLGFLVLFLTMACVAADWPQFLGPNRDSHAPGLKLPQGFFKNGPKQLWEKKLGAGFSGPIVAGQRCLIFHRVGGEEIVDAVDAATGKDLWRYAYQTNYRDDFGFDEGPRSTPVAAGDHVYTLGAEGSLHCVELATGKKVWSRALNEEYRVKKGFFGVATSPVVEGSILLVNVGSAGAGVVGLDRMTGKEIWRATNHEASYASPIIATLNGKRIAIFFTREGLVALDPANGKESFSKRWRARIAASVNAATPLLLGELGDHVFVSTSYDVGGLLTKFQNDQWTEVWANDDTLSCHYNTPVAIGPHLFGLHGRQEYGVTLRCVRWQDGKVLWEKERFGCAALLAVGQHFLALTEKGELAAFAADAGGYQELSRHKLLEDVVRTHPAIAHGRLYARDPKKLMCWQLAE